VALLGLLFAFLYLGFGRWTHSDFFTGVANARSSDYLFFSYQYEPQGGELLLSPCGLGR
jgi:hypothetical protein